MFEENFVGRHYINEKKHFDGLRYEGVILKPKANFLGRL